jgi:hypothetical protein
MPDLRRVRGAQRSTRRGRRCRECGRACDRSRGSQGFARTPIGLAAIACSSLCGLQLTRRPHPSRHTRSPWHLSLRQMNDPNQTMGGGRALPDGACPTPSRCAARSAATCGAPPEGSGLCGEGSKTTDEPPFTAERRKRSMVAGSASKKDQDPSVTSPGRRNRVK